METGRETRLGGRRAVTDIVQNRSFIGDLRTVLASSGFRRLFATRLISQTGDGVFNAGLGAYVFFSATSFPNPGAAATAFAVLYLPYSLIGPFAGVFIDRWSRRQIMLWSALLRAGCAAVIAVFVAGGAFGLPIWLGALAVLGINRFFLSSLSAALPHVLEPDELVMGNSVGPTSGTVVAFIGGIIGIAVRLVAGPGQLGSAATLLAGAVCYLLAGLSARRIGRAALGPDLGEAPLGSVLVELGGVAAGLVDGLRHVWHKRSARAALTATGSHRFLYGILLLMSILLYRNYFYPGSHNGNEALSHFLPVVVGSAIGYGVAAWLTPIVTRRRTKEAWITALLAAAGVLVVAFGLSFGQLEFIAIGFGLGVVAQGVAICTTTILQREMEDDFRGRVFSVYDMMFNVTFVIGAAVSAGFMPVTGRSAPMVLVVGCGYVVAAVGYRLMAGQSSPASSPSAEPAPGSPASRAQRSSS